MLLASPRTHHWREPLPYLRGWVFMRWAMTSGAGRVSVRGLRDRVPRGCGRPSRFVDSPRAEPPSPRSQPPMFAIAAKTCWTLPEPTAKSRAARLHAPRASRQPWRPCPRPGARSSRRCRARAASPPSSERPAARARAAFGCCAALARPRPAASRPPRRHRVLPGPRAALPRLALLLLLTPSPAACS